MTFVIIGVSFVIVVGGVLIVGRAIRKLLRAHETDVRGDDLALGQGVAL